MGAQMRPDEDALTYRIKKEKRKRIVRYIRWTLLGILIVSFVLLKILFGFASYWGDSLAPQMSGHNGIIYAKMIQEYQSDDLIVFEDITNQKIMIKKGSVFDSEWKNNATKKIKILGKVISHIPLGGSD